MNGKGFFDLHNESSHPDHQIDITRGETDETEGH